MMAMKVTMMTVVAIMEMMTIMMVMIMMMMVTMIMCFFVRPSVGLVKGSGEVRLSCSISLSPARSTRKE